MVKCGENDRIVKLNGEREREREHFDIKNMQTFIHICLLLANSALAERNTPALFTTGISNGTELLTNDSKIVYFMSWVNIHCNINVSSGNETANYVANFFAFSTPTSQKRTV